MPEEDEDDDGPLLTLLFEDFSVKRGRLSHLRRRSKTNGS